MMDLIFHAAKTFPFWLSSKLDNFRNKNTATILFCNLPTVFYGLVIDIDSHFSPPSKLAAISPVLFSVSKLCYLSPRGSFTLFCQSNYGNFSFFFLLWIFFFFLFHILIEKKFIPKIEAKLTTLERSCHWRKSNLERKCSRKNVYTFYQKRFLFSKINSQTAIKSTEKTGPENTTFSLTFTDRLMMMWMLCWVNTFSFLFLASNFLILERENSGEREQK